MQKMVARARKTISDILTHLFPTGAPLHTPDLAGNEREYLASCIDSTFVSSVGAYVDQVERELEQITGASRAVAVCSGTAALHTCLLLAGVNPQDEVLMPALTFVATANSALQFGAVPHFVDVEQVSYGVDSDKLKQYLEEIVTVRGGVPFNRYTDRKISALVVVHAFGTPADLKPLSEISDQYGIPMIEDAAEALGSSYHGSHVGTVGKLSALSFNGNKIVTAGGGGAILTNDSELGKIAKHITTTAKVPSRWEYVHDQPAFNYRMPNINAALACAQLERLKEFLEAKRVLHRRYQEAFEQVPSDTLGFELVCEPPHTVSNYWLINLRLSDGDEQEQILEELWEKGIQARPPWRPLHQLPFLAEYPRMNLDNTEAAAKCLLSLPSSSHQLTAS